MTDQTLTLRGTVPGLKAPVTIRRDEWGIAHVQAMNEPDAWFGQGFASAQDRLWHMEYDRRRATGRWAEVAGRAAVAGDTLARRLQLGLSAAADVAAMSPQTRTMFEAYAAGINAFLQSGAPLPMEYALAGLMPEPWQPWHSVAGFKVRHVLMGVWQKKLAQAQLLAKIGPEAYGTLDGRPPAGSAVILPPGGGYARLFEEGSADLRQAAEQLGFLAEAEAGSNSWAVHGSHTTTGTPVLCNDAHRLLDVPNVYWPVHIRCPEFNVIGATFPGVPGFPHFGHNGSVAWNITHTSADYQDIYIERFDSHDPVAYETPEGWATAKYHKEWIQVVGADPVEIELWRTRHGPVVHGNPRRGVALTLRYTATDGPCRGFEALRPMLMARTVSELHETQRPWVDPVNNLVSADTAGNIGYLTRGYLPIRSASPAPPASQTYRQFPVPGWTGEHEWTGRVPFEQLPQAINPLEGLIATANQAVISSDEPYIAHDFAPPSRAERILELLTRSDRLPPDEIAAMQGDTTSRPARTWAQWLARCGPFEGDAERARALLADWDGNLLPESSPAFLYGEFRRAIARALFEPVVGKEHWLWLTATDVTTTHSMVSRWLANVVASLGVALDQAGQDQAGQDQAGRAGEDPRTRTSTRREAGAPPHDPSGTIWPVRQETLLAALATAWQAARAKSGPDPASWRWDARHGTRARHPLSTRFPEHAAALNPHRVAVGGDGDTIQAASYLWGERADFDIVGLSVYRQVVDLQHIEHATCVIPGGVSGAPGTPHFVDQLERWRTHRRVPMHYSEADVRTHTVHTLSLVPA